jgi:hypothetical protein
MLQPNSDETIMTDPLTVYLAGEKQASALRLALGAVAVRCSGVLMVSISGTAVILE